MDQLRITRSQARSGDLSDRQKKLLKLVQKAVDKREEADEDRNPSLRFRIEITGQRA